MPQILFLTPLSKESNAFFSDALLARAEAKNPSLVAKKANGIRTVHPRDYQALKAILAGEVAKGISEDDLVYARGFLLELSQLP